MKTIKILVLIFCVALSMSSRAQNKNILKVTYTVSCVSDFLVGMLKKQIQDPKEFSKILTMMEAYKVYSSFYQNLKTKESVFVMDSIKEVKNLNVAGYTFFVLKKQNGSFYGKELFMGKDIYFKGSTKEIKWTMTNEQKEINGYQCKKAHLKDNPKVYVWFTPQIAVNGGPCIFFGLPGLVLGSNSPFKSVDAAAISYSSEEEFQNKLTEIKEKINMEKSIPLTEVLAKKENFRRMVEKGK